MLPPDLTFPHSAPENPEEEPVTDWKLYLRSKRKQIIFDYSLVLASQNQIHQVSYDGKAWILWLPEHEIEMARNILHTYVRENKGFNLESEPRSLDLLLSPLLYLIWPTAFHFGVRLSAWPSWWNEKGNADADKILAGEWWRCLTATTLHTDHPHFLGNLFSGYFMINLLAHRLGMGSILLFGVLTSILANAAVAIVSQSHHLSIGFSTTVFATLGMLAGVETLHRPKSDGLRFRRVHPLAAAFAMAILVGLGENADIKAHFFGFLFGGITGLLTRYLPKSLNQPLDQWVMGIMAYALYALCWAMALGWFRYS